MSTNRSPLQQLIVRRSLSPAYYFFLQTFAESSRIELIVDRRLTERRQIRHRRFGDRRRTERRGAIPATWSQGDFVVVRAESLNPPVRTSAAEAE
jgi:hypothetical protein